MLAQGWIGSATFRAAWLSMELLLDPISYSRLAGVVFALVAVLQLARALAGWPVEVGKTRIPVWASWVAFVIAAVLAWNGITARLV